MRFAEKYKHYETFLHNVSAWVKQLAIRVIGREITYYWGRHTWQTWAANELRIPGDLRSRAMGHSNNRVTDIYTEYDYTQVDEANRKLIDFVVKALGKCYRNHFH